MKGVGRDNRMRPWQCVAWLAVAALALPAGCRDRNTARDTGDDGITKTVEDGPVRLSLTLTPKDPSVDQPAHIDVELVSDSDVTVRVDDYLPALLDGDRRFELRAKPAGKTEAKPTDDGKLRWHYRYDLVFVLPGDYELPAAAASYHDMRTDNAEPSKEDETKHVETETIALSVSDTRKQALTPDEMAHIDMPDPVELRRPWSIWAWAVAAGAVLAMGFVAYAIRRRRVGGDAVVVIPAHEWAHGQLAALLGEDLIGKGMVQEFYYRISGIVRGYIERRFKVSAPEMTTEEFLAAAGSDMRFQTDHTTALDDFLTACDMVKYARHEPTSVEADQAVKAAIAFVDQTTARDEGGAEVPPAVGVSGGHAP